MSGTLDNRNVEVIDTRNTVLAVLVYPDGTVRLQCSAKNADGSTDHAWVAETLRRIAESQDARLTQGFFIRHEDVP